MTDTPHLLCVAPRHLRALADAIEKRQKTERDLWLEARQGKPTLYAKRTYQAALRNLAAVIEEIKAQTP